MFDKLFAKIKPHKHPDVNSEPLRLASDDRNVFYETKDAEKLARMLLARARDEYQSRPSGTKVTIEVPEGYGHIHNMELMLAFMNLDETYGFRCGAMYNNTHDLVKI